MKSLDGVEGFELLGFRPDTRSNKWFYSLLCNTTDCSRDKVIETLAAHKIQSRPVWGIIPDQKPYAGALEYQVERARGYRELIVNVPCSTNLTHEEVNAVVDVLRNMVD